MLLPPALAGVALGFLLMGRISEAAFGPLIGWIILALIVLQFVRGAMGEKLDPIFESHGFGIFMGMLAGVTTMIANAAGPVATLYFLSVRLPKWNLIGTSSWLFFVINLCKVPFSASLGLTNAYSLSLAAVLAPLVVTGFFCGRKTGRDHAAENLRAIFAHLHGDRRAAAGGMREKLQSFRHTLTHSICAVRGKRSTGWTDSSR